MVKRNEYNEDLEKQADAFLASYDVENIPSARKEEVTSQRVREDNEFSLYARRYGGSLSEKDNVDINDPEVERMIQKAFYAKHKADKAERHIIRNTRLQMMKEAANKIKNRPLTGNAEEAEKRLMILLGVKKS